MVRKERLILGVFGVGGIRIFFWKETEGIKERDMG
jgi:hypothetical protein